MPPNNDIRFILFLLRLYIPYSVNKPLVLGNFTLSVTRRHFCSRLWWRVNFMFSENPHVAYNVFYNINTTFLSIFNHWLVLVRAE